MPQVASVTYNVLQNNHQNAETEAHNDGQLNETNAGICFVIRISSGAGSPEQT